MSDTQIATVTPATSVELIKPAAWPQPVKVLKATLDQAMSRIEDLCKDKRLTPERMVQLVITATLKNPKLQECETISIVGAMLDALQLGLEPCGPKQHGYLITYKVKIKEAGKRDRWVTKAEWQPGYRGLLTLVQRGEAGVKRTFAEVVHEGDQFSWQRGTDPRIDHVPAVDADRHRRPISHVYAVGWRDGYPDFEVMSACKDCFAPCENCKGKGTVWDGDESMQCKKCEGDGFLSPALCDVEHIRAKSKSAFDGPWVTDWSEMAKKVVLKRITKRWPLDDNAALAIEMDNERDGRNSKAVIEQQPAEELIVGTKSGGGQVPPASQPAAAADAFSPAAPTNTRPADTTQPSSPPPQRPPEAEQVVKRMEVINASLCGGLQIADKEASRVRNQFLRAWFGAAALPKDHAVYDQPLTVLEEIVKTKDLNYFSKNASAAGQECRQRFEASQQTEDILAIRMKAWGWPENLVALARTLQQRRQHSPEDTVEWFEYIKIPTWQQDDAAAFLGLTTVTVEAARFIGTSKETGVSIHALVAQVEQRLGKAWDSASEERLAEAIYQVDKEVRGKTKQPASLPEGDDDLLFNT